MDFTLPIAITPVVPENNLFLVSSPKPGFFAALADHFIPHARNNYHPHIFSRRLTALLSALLITAKIFTVGVMAWGPIAPVYSSAITESNVVTLTNQSRQGMGLGMLTENSLLDKAAQSKADDMLKKSYFSHNTPDGHTPWDFITASGYSYITAGENLAVNFTQAENVEAAWMNSPGHRANILNKNYQNIGVGISQGLYQGHQAIFVVQMFGTLANQKISLNDVPTKVASQSAPLPGSEIAAPQSFNFTDTQTQVQGDQLVVTAKVAGEAVKVLATYGQQGIMLTPGENNLWTGSLNLSSLSASGSSLVLKSYDMSGSLQSTQVADFAGSTLANYNLSPQVESASINTVTQNFYLIFIATILVCLILAVLIKRKVQHVSLVANGAFMVILAVLLYVR